MDTGPSIIAMKPLNPRNQLVAVWNEQAQVCGERGLDRSREPVSSWMEE